PLRAAGSLHSLNDCAITTGTTVRMDAFKAIGEPTGDTITVGAGVRMLELRDTLKARRRQIEVVPEIGNATAGSVACCGTKDVSIGPGGLGQISSTVVGVGMVDANGEIVRVTDPERLRVLRSSYGLLGMVFEVTFRTIPRRALSYEYAVLDVAPVPTLEAVLGAASGFLGFLMPYHGKLVVERRFDTSGQITPIDQLRRGIRDRAWEFVGTVARLPLRELWLPVLDVGLEQLLSAVDNFDTFAGDSMLDFASGMEGAFDFAFWAFPRSSWPAAVPEYLTFCRDFQAANGGFRSALPTEVYFIRRDDSALLSFCPDEDVFTLDLVDLVPRSSHEERDWRRMNDQFNQLAARHGARPLLNQTKFLSPAHMQILRSAWPPSIRQRWEEFARRRREADPGGRFLTPYFQALI
ncbi:MAG: FAD-binding protein, partial [Candidatus Rokuibacteriota bacterium]